MPASSKDRKTSLPVILLAAVLHGWTLYGLHLAIVGSRWPATQPGWLLGLYAVAIFIPLTVQSLSAYARERWTWIVLAAFAALFFYAGWHHGAHVMDQDATRFASSGEWFPLALVLGVLWLMMLPFVQCRMAHGRWRVRYETLFATAWRNKLTLAEAALFTGLFWLLLVLWQALFRMLGVMFFAELFSEPIFVYPVTALVFGMALHLIGSVDTMTRVVLEQVLNVLKWLALVAGLILALFTIALVFELPAMISSGERAIDAAWLLWLIAVTVLLVNAAYRDGTVETPYPRWIGIALRCVVPLIVVIALTALYALYLRIDAYGFTVERVWACIVAGAAFLYAVGYGIAARSAHPWMSGVTRVNVVTALILIATIALALTPVLSPYRIAANSQFRMALAAPAAGAGTVVSAGRAGVTRARARARADGTVRAAENIEAPLHVGTPMHYLRFSSGAYGAAKLRELANLQQHPRAAEIRAAAAEMIAQQDPWQLAAPAGLQERLAALVIHPQGRMLEAALLERLQADLQEPAVRGLIGNPRQALGGVFVDLNDDETDEFVLVAGVAALAYERRAGAWQRFGTMHTRSYSREADAITSLRAGNVAAQVPAWRDLRIGGQVFRLDANEADAGAIRPGEPASSDSPGDADPDDGGPGDAGSDDSGPGDVRLDADGSGERGSGGRGS